MISLLKRDSAIRITPRRFDRGMQCAGGLVKQSLTLTELKIILEDVHGSSIPGANDGTRVHIRYESFGKASSPAAKSGLERAKKLGLPMDCYTGRVNRIWKSNAGDLCLTIFVELERNRCYRTLNLVKGKVYNFVVLGD